jgi:hypothetical protein
MTSTPTVLPRAAVRAIGGTLLLMALFTTAWAGIANAGLQGADNYLHLTVCSLLSLVFIIYGIQLMLRARRFPKSRTAEDLTTGRKMWKAYAIVFGIEGVAIGAASAILGISGHGEYVLPVIALIVGLHFYPFARIFDRRVDYFIASWTCGVALAAIFATYSNSRPQGFIMAFLGIGVSFSTIGYGLYTLRYARSYGLISGILNQRRV